MADHDLNWMLEKLQSEHTALEAVCAILIAEIASLHPDARLKLDQITSTLHELPPAQSPETSRGHALNVVDRVSALAFEIVTSRR